MALNKDKVRAAAQRYLQKGQLDKAIREFNRIVEDDPKDVRTLLKVGDLQARKGDAAEATATYNRVAEHYSDQGFFLKAVAVYKQILKLQPTLTHINLKLAELYHQLGLISDATAQYRQISLQYEQEGKLEPCAEILQKMLELDPENIAGRIKLADIRAKQGMVEEAREAFQDAASVLKSQHRIDDYIKVAERIIHFDPSDLTTTRELADVYIQKGDPRRALAKLQICFRATPKDITTLTLLAAAFRDLGQENKALSVYRELARVHHEAQDIESLASAYERILTLAPGDAEAQAGLEQLRSGPVTDRDSRADLGGDPAHAVSTGSDDGAPASVDVDKLLVEAEIYIKYGLADKAMAHLDRVFEIEPLHREARYKQVELLTAAGDPNTAADVLCMLASRALASEVADLARSDLEAALAVAPGHSEARELMATLAPEPEPETLRDDGSDSDAFAETTDVMEVDVDVMGGDLEVEVELDDDEAQWVSDTDLTATPPEGPVADPHGPSDESVHVAVDLDDWEETPATPEEPIAQGDAPAAALSPDPPVTMTDPSVSPPETPRAASTTASTPTPRVAPAVDDELEALLASAVPSQRKNAAAKAEDTPPSEFREAQTSAGDPPSAEFAAVIGEEPEGLPTDGLGGHAPHEEVLEEAEVFEEAELIEDDDDIEPIDNPLESDEALADAEFLDDESVLEPGHNPETATVENTLASDVVFTETSASDAATAIQDQVPAVEAAQATKPPAMDSSSLEGPAHVDLADAAFAESAEEPALEADGWSAEATTKPAPGDDDGSAFQPEAAESSASVTPNTDGTLEAPLSDEHAEDTAAATADLADTDMLDEELDEVRFFAEQGLVDDALGTLAMLREQYGDDPRLTALEHTLKGGDAPEDEAEAAASPQEPQEDLEPEPEIHASLADELAEELDRAADDDDYQMSVTDVFEEFKRGVAEQVEEGDYETHYNLGIAYREMGLLDDAMREFEVAQRAGGHPIGALTMLGICQLELGRNEDALRSFQTGLHTASVTDAEAVALRYEIGQAYEHMGRWGEALRFFEKACAMDPGFRDVAQRLGQAREQAIRAGVEASADGLEDLLGEDAPVPTSESSKGDKISYL